MKDLETFQHEVVEPRVKPLVAEVVKSYSAGALRAATVSLWVAVVADLVHKIRNLAETGDGAASEEIKKLDRAVANGSVADFQKFERNLLELATDRLEILSPREKVELARLYEDRNLCAHPGFEGGDDIFAPTSEATRAHLASASKSVFSQRAIAGKRLVEELGQELLRDSWPGSDKDELVEYLQARYFSRSRESVQRNLFKVLIKACVRPPEEDWLIAKRGRVAVAALAQAMPQMHSELLTSVLGNWERAHALDDTALVRAVGAFSASPSFRAALPDTAKMRLSSLLQKRDCAFLVEQRFFASGAPDLPSITGDFNALVSDLDIDQLEVVVRYASRRGAFVPAVIVAVGAARSFREAERRLRLLHLCAASLTADDIVTLSRQIEQNDYDQVRLASETEALLLSTFRGCSLSDALVKAWKALAEQLHEAGKQDSGKNYLYEDLLAAVNEGRPGARSD